MDFQRDNYLLALSRRRDQWQVLLLHPDPFLIPKMSACWGCLACAELAKPAWESSLSAWIHGSGRDRSHLLILGTAGLRWPGWGWSKRWAHWEGWAQGDSGSLQQWGWGCGKPHPSLPATGTAACSELAGLWLDLTYRNASVH